MVISYRVSARSPPERSGASAGSSAAGPGCVAARARTGRGERRHVEGLRAADGDDHLLPQRLVQLDRAPRQLFGARRERQRLRALCRRRVIERSTWRAASTERIATYAGGVAAQAEAELVAAVERLARVQLAVTLCRSPSPCFTNTASENPPLLRVPARGWSAGSRSTGPSAAVAADSATGMSRRQPHAGRCVRATPARARASRASAGHVGLAQEVLPVAGQRRARAAQDGQSLTCARACVSSSSVSSPSASRSST